MRLEDVARHCQEETQRYFQQEKNDTNYCYELLRQALQLQNADAFTYCYTNYQALVRGWISRHPQFYGSGEDIDYFLSVAFTNFYFALRGNKFDRFASLPQLLKYLKCCVHTAISQHFRGTDPAGIVSLDHDEPSSLLTIETFSNLADIWNRIIELLPDESDQLLAHCVFSQNLKPAQIVELYPQQWKTAREVSVDLQRIRRRLQQDYKLRDLLGVEGDDE